MDLEALRTLLRNRRRRSTAALSGAFPFRNEVDLQRFIKAFGQNTTGSLFRVINHQTR
jgi:hypothetical protein